MKGYSNMLGETNRNRLVPTASLACIIMCWTACAALSETLAVDQVIQKNIEARGGAQAWRAIQTMTLEGKMDAGTKTGIQLPFVLKLERPRKSRLEISFAESTALQIYDGTNGWKVRPFLNRLQVEPFTPEETQIAAEQSDLDGFLIDHGAKGIRVELIGKEPVENRDAYKLRLTLKNGSTREVWLDANTFLEIMIEGAPRKLDGKMHTVQTYFRDYRKVSGLMIPFVLETAVEKVKDTHKIAFDSVVVNPVLDSDAFLRPDVRGMKPAKGLVRSSLTMPQATVEPLIKPAGNN